ncbi:MAG TPA: hypothetical protein DCW68_06730 [Rhodospirillaceae bacterium]|nr:MAG: hypothetical protein A2018_01240 [Alphaproteobacteria bacterium GWF2_58_20]HAU29782.1 hypothetical protein [Rhodospirillaceae bacterium]
MSVVFSIATIILLIALSFFFSGSETAFTAVSRARMHALEQDGNKRAAIINRLREHREQMIGALLIGNNIVNITASALATGVLITFFGKSGVAIATLVMSVLLIIFSEVLPKTLAIFHADRFCLAVAPVVRFCVALFSPINRTVSVIVKPMLRLFGISMTTSPEADLEELRGAIELHGTTSGETEEEIEEVRHERAMLRSILDLTDVTVGEIMTHRRNMSMIDASLPAGKIVDEVLASPYTRLPLWRDNADNNILGVIHAKEMLRQVRTAGGDLAKIHFEDFAAKPWFVPDSTTLLDQLEAFRDRHEHFALVVDEYGSLMGVVTLEDILEEIVGDISDEHDIAVAGVRPQPGGSYVINGNVTIRDLNREFEWKLPDEDYSTIAGLVLHEARRIPLPGQIFVFFGFKFEIMRRQRNQITLLRVTPPKGD